MKFIVEHLDERLYAWSLLEYRHISDIAGRRNLRFTNIKGAASRRRLAELGRVSEKSVTELKLENACVLDPAAKRQLSSEDKFDNLIFGGILGDSPMRQSTKRELTSKLRAEARNLGRRQMSTDTAVNVTKKILSGNRLQQLKFRDGIEIDIKPHESVQLPFRYLVEDGKPVLPPGFMQFLRKRNHF